MAAGDATLYPIKGQAWRLPVEFRDTSNNLLSTWTGVTASLVIDGGAPITLSGGDLPVEVSTSGIGYMDITAAHMNGALIQVKALVTNANAVNFTAAVYTLNLTIHDGNYTQQTVERFEDILNNIWSVACGHVTQSPSQLLAIADDGHTLMGGSCSTSDSAGMNRNKLVSPPA